MQHRVRHHRTTSRTAVRAELSDLQIMIQDGDQINNVETASFQRMEFANASGGPLPTPSLQTPEHYQWKYRPPAGVAKVSIDRLGHDVVAHVAAIPVILREHEHNRLADLRYRHASGASRAAFVSARA
jgi:hypothetical protein